MSQTSSQRVKGYSHPVVGPSAHVITHADWRRDAQALTSLPALSCNPELDPRKSPDVPHVAHTSRVERKGPSALYIKGLSEETIIILLIILLPKVNET